MFILLIVLTALIIAFHKYTMKAVNNYESYGGTTARQEWINFERERLSR